MFDPLGNKVLTRRTLHISHLLIILKLINLIDENNNKNSGFREVMYEDIRRLSQNIIYTINLDL